MDAGDEAFDIGLQVIDIGKTMAISVGRGIQTMEESSLNTERVVAHDANRGGNGISFQETKTIDLFDKYIGVFLDFNHRTVPKLLIDFVDGVIGGALQKHS